MPLDWATAELLEQMAAGGGKPLHESTVEEARALAAGLADQVGPAPAMFRVEEHSLAVPGGAVPIRVLVPLEQPAGVIVYYHGGGWVVGSIDESDTVARKLAERTSCSVVLVDYRLAPEHRYPVAVDDSWAAAPTQSGFGFRWSSSRQASTELDGVSCTSAPSCLVSSRG